MEAEAAEARAEAVGEEAVGAAAALGGARTATTFEVMIIYFQLVKPTYSVIALAQLTY